MARPVEKVSRQVRRALFMTAFVLRRKIPELASLYERLRDRGNPSVPGQQAIAWPRIRRDGCPSTTTFTVANGG